MLKSNLKIALRIFLKNKSYTLINIIGLASALTVFFLLIEYVRFEFSYEDNNSNSDELVRLTIDYLDGGAVFEQDCETYPPLGPMIKDQIVEAKEYIRVYRIDEFTIKANNKVLKEDLVYGVDPSFFQLFNYPFIQGNESSAFQSPNEAVLTVSEAIKVFGKEDVVGETILFTSYNTPFTVVGVINDPPFNTHLKFDMLISYKSLGGLVGERDDNWSGNNTFTYIQLNDKTDYKNFKSRLAAFNKELTDLGRLVSQRIISQPINDIHLRSNKSFEAEQNGDLRTVLFLLGVALLVLFIALFNYINLSTSKSLDRAREVGIRKVYGSNRLDIIYQFCAESLLMFAAAGITALIFLALFFSSFRTLAQLPETWSFLDNGSFWLLFILTLITASAISSSVPATILASFKPVVILKGKFTHSISGNRLRKFLTIVQFGITLFLLTQTLVSSLQLSFMRNKDLGLDADNILVIKTPDNFSVDSYKSFRGDVLNNPLFERVSFSKAVPGMSAHLLTTIKGVSPVLALEKHNNNMYIYSVDHEFIDLMGFNLLSGIGFFAGNNEKQVLVNEEAVRIWNIGAPELAIGRKLSIQGTHYNIMGVLEDFHQFSPKEDIVPMIFFHSKDGGKHISVKASNDQSDAQVKALKDIFNSHFPNSYFESFFLDQNFDLQFQKEEQFQSVFTLLSILAIIIASLGLYGMASFAITKRSKEIGIRKVLGSSEGGIIFLISNHFVKLMGLSILIGMPISYYLVEQWLNNYSYQAEIPVGLYFIPPVSVLFVAFLTIIGRAYKTSMISPSISLRNE